MRMGMAGAVVRVRMECEVAGRGRHSVASPVPDAADLAGQHPPTDEHDRDRSNDRCPAHGDVRGDDVGRGEHDRGKRQDPDGVRQADRRAEAERMARRPSRAYEIGGHQCLAWPGVSAWPARARPRPRATAGRRSASGRGSEDVGELGSRRRPARSPARGRLDRLRARGRATTIMLPTDGRLGTAPHPAHRATEGSVRPRWPPRPARHRPAGLEMRSSGYRRNRWSSCRGGRLRRDAG